MKCPSCDSSNTGDLDCNECLGDGSDYEGEEPCSQCDGDGYVEGIRECLECGYIFEGEGL